MEVKVRGSKVSVTKILSKNETYRIQKGKKFESVTFMRKPQEIIGFSSMTEDGYSIIVLDYDNVDLSVVEEDYTFIQEKYQLPQAYLLKTTKGYHVICLARFLPSKVYEILLHTRCDDAYKDSPLRTPYRSYVLRLSAKKGGKRPKFIKFLGLECYNNCHKCSSAHYDLMKKLYPSRVIQKGELTDYLKAIRLQMYETTT